MLNRAAGKNLLKINYQVARYTVQAVSNQILNRDDQLVKRKRAIAITAENSRNLLKNLNVNVSFDNQDQIDLSKNYFMVCNHMSYLDILVLSSIRPSVFVTSVEMEKTFFLGDIAKMGGSFFVDRINRRKMKQEVEALIDLLKQNFNVFIFPEGTSTNGLQILPFKKSLFRVPFHTEFPILPICLKYHSIDGQAFSEANCDQVCWYGDMTFAPHVLKLMKVKNIEASVRYLKPLYPKDFENHGDLTLAAEKAIRDVYFQ